MEFFRQRINSTQKQKRKAQTDLGGVYNGCEGEIRKKYIIGVKARCARRNLELREI